jgi:hypothetical protein
MLRAALQSAGYREGSPIPIPTKLEEGKLSSTLLPPPRLLAHLGEATVEVLGIDMSTWASDSENSDY